MLNLPPRKEYVQEGSEGIIRSQVGFIDRKIALHCVDLRFETLIKP